MILQKEIRNIAALHGVPISTIDKDWVLGHIIHGIYQNNDLNSKLIFKGGTCLRKCYFRDYRFSEDLDFSLTSPISNIQSTIESVLLQVMEDTGILFHIDSSAEMRHNNIPVGFKTIVKYWGANHLKNMAIPEHTRWHSYFKIEIVEHELIYFPIVTRSIIHDYSDQSIISGDIPCYDLQEVIAEKLRAILQRKYTAPRDYYDLWYILQVDKPKLNWSGISKAFKKKADFKNVTCSSVDDFFAPGNIQKLRSHWMPSLGHHIGKEKLPPVESVLLVLKEILSHHLII